MELDNSWPDDKTTERKRYQEDKNIKKNTVRKTTRRRNEKTISPSSDENVNTMRRYIVKTDSVDRKHEDNTSSKDNHIHEDKTERQEPASLSPRQHHGENTHISVEKKLTFETTYVRKNNVMMNDRISRFQELVDKSQVCVTGSGRCASHNWKLVRDIVKKKQSFGASVRRSSSRRSGGRLLAMT